MEVDTIPHIKNSIDKNYLLIEKPFTEDFEVMLVPNMEPVENHSKLFEYTRQLIRLYLLLHSVLP